MSNDRNAVPYRTVVIDAVMQAWDEWLTDIDQVKRLSAEMHSAATTLEASAAVYALVDTETSEFEYASKILTAKAWRQEAAYFGIH